MAQKYPKHHHNHLFLAWLRANRFRFPFEPQVIRIKNYRVDFTFQGFTNAIRFQYFSQRGAWISVDAMWQGSDWDGLACFYGAEEHTTKGWTTLREPDKTRCHYWQTREKLWEEVCFDAFLTWCKNKLTPNCWLELYDGFRIMDAKIQKEDALPNQFMADWETEMAAHYKFDAPRLKKMAASARYIAVSIFK